MTGVARGRRVLGFTKRPVFSWIGCAERPRSQLLLSGRALPTDPSDREHTSTKTRGSELVLVVLVSLLDGSAIGAGCFKKTLVRLWFYALIWLESGFDSRNVKAKGSFQASFCQDDQYESSDCNVAVRSL